MTGFVLDGSVALAWGFPDESSDYAAKALRALADAEAQVPPIWPLEIANGLLVAERRKRITPAESDLFREKLRTLPISIDRSSGRAWLDDCLRLGRLYTLSAYDASYLLLSQYLSLPLATLDGPLRRAAGQAGVPLYAP